MKKLLIILPSLFFALAANAQQTEDEVYIGKGKTFGNYKSTGIIIPDIDKGTKLTSGQKPITGTVVGYCKKDCCYRQKNSCTIDVKTEEGIVTVGTKDHGFTVPNKLVGRTIIIEGVNFPRRRHDINPGKKENQKDIQFAATGIKVID